MSRKGQEEMICQLFQENQVRHREIMGIVTNQALDAIVAQQIIEQIFAFAPAPPCPYSQCSQEQVSARCFPRIICGSRHCQHRVPPPSNHSCCACRLISEVANAHRFARARLGHNDMPASLEPGLSQQTLKPALKGGLNEAVEKRKFANYHQSPSFSRYRMARGSHEYTFSGSGVALGSWRLSRSERARLSSASTTYEGWISSRCRSNCRAFSLSRRVLPRCFLVLSISAWICARTAATFSPAACALAVSALRMAFASHSLTRCPMKAGQLLTPMYNCARIK